MDQIRNITQYKWLQASGKLWNILHPISIFIGGVGGAVHFGPPSALIARTIRQPLPALWVRSQLWAVRLPARGTYLGHSVHVWIKMQVSKDASIEILSSYSRIAILSGWMVTVQEQSKKFKLSGEQTFFTKSQQTKFTNMNTTEM